MKLSIKNLILSIFLTFALTACSSDDEEKAMDNLLSGTTWISTNLKPTDPPTSEVWVDDTFKKILTLFPSLSYTVENEPTIKNSVNKIKGDKITYENTLNFSYNTSVYTDLEYTLSITKENENEFKKYIIPNQVCLNPSGHYALDVKSEGIYYYQTDSPSESKLILKLDNNNHYEFIKTIRVISEKSDTIFKKKTIEKLNYQLEYNKIIMTNTNIKLVGELDESNWIISLSQIMPSQNNLGKFKLKSTK